MTIDSRGRVVVTGPGYIKTLFDEDNDGVADSQKLFATTPGGGMGLCSDGPYLYFTGDGALWRYADMDGDGVADGPPERILPVRHAEHGGHGIRQGPDGSWWLIAGNDGEIHVGLINDARSPVREPVAGALIRFSANFQSTTVFAHGFRNPYDFDFNWLGDLFTYDSDVERDYLLPWYTPTRIYHVAHGGHHGWRLPGFTRSYHQPDYDPAVIPMIRSMGRGSPTGVVSYRHRQFPPLYLNGLFLCDWTFGKVWFAATEPAGASYTTEPELFLDPVGESGFAPTDAVVAPDGSLLVSVGGRKTRGAVYRIHWVADPAREVLARGWAEQAGTDVDIALNAPQPLDAWSRAIWCPRAARLGPRPFDLAAGTESLPDSVRIRAIEILTEVHGGLMTSTAQAAARSGSPFVRARVAWSLGMVPCADFAPILASLASDPSPHVRRCALEGITERVETVPPALVLQAALGNAGHGEKRLRQLSAHLATALPLPEWQEYYKGLARGPAQGRLTCALAVAERYPTNGIHRGVLSMATEVLKLQASPSEQLQAIELLQSACGGWRIQNPSQELYSSYELVMPIEWESPAIRGAAAAVRQVFPGTEPLVAREAARFLGMLRDPDPSLPSRVMARVGPRTPPAEDFHFLTVLSRLPAGRPDTNLVDRCAAGLLDLNRKLEGEANRPKQNWADRHRELVMELVRRTPTLPEALLRSPGFIRSGGMNLADAFDFQDRVRAARLLIQGVDRTGGPSWSPSLVRLLSLLPPKEMHPVLRAQWGKPELRNELLLGLSRDPEPVDRDRFVGGLASFEPEVVHASLRSLASLPREPAATPVEGALRLLDRSLRDRKPSVEPGEILPLLNHLTGQAFPARDLAGVGGDLAQLRRSYQPVFDWCAARFPNVAAGVGVEAQDATAWERSLASVAWSRGNPVQGEVLFQARACSRCHGSQSSLGPDLSGVTRRWTPADLFSQIRYPSKEVAEAYQAVELRLRDGTTHVGLVAFLSADGVILRTADGNTVRIPESSIASRRPIPQSIMPEGLLEGLNPTDLADLYAYLKSLAPR